MSRHQSASSQNMGDVVEVITQLGATFTKLIELMLSKEIKVQQKKYVLNNYYNLN